MPKRLTPEDLEAKIIHEITFNAGCAHDALTEIPGLVAIEVGSATGALDRLTICILTLENGFTVVGKSAPIHSENFDAKIGAEMARKDALNQLWPLMGYAEREMMLVISKLPAED